MNSSLQATKIMTLKVVSPLKVECSSLQGVQRRMVLVVIFRHFKINFICFADAIFDIVHAVKAKHDLC